MGTSRARTNANLLYYTKLQISDNSATKVLKEIKYYDSLPEIPTASTAPDMQQFNDRGAVQAMELGEDAVNFEDFSITIDLTAADIQDVGTSDYQIDWFNIMNKGKDPSDGTTALTSTNTGTVNVKNGLNPQTTETTAISIPAEIFTLRLEMLHNLDGTIVTGHKWEQVQPIGVTFGDSGEGSVTMTLNFRVMCAPVKIDALTTNP